MPIPTSMMLAGSRIKIKPFRQSRRATTTTICLGMSALKETDNKIIATKMSKAPKIFIIQRER